MKKLFILLLSMISLNVFGQDHWLGFQGGWVRSNITSAISFNDLKFHNGVTAGLNYEYRFHNKFSVGVDLLYVQKGYNFGNTFMDESGNVTSKFNDSQQLFDYLSIPIKIGYTAGNKLKGFVKTGVCLSKIKKAEGIYSDVDMNGAYLGTYHMDYLNTVTKFDLGGLIELGARYGLKNNLELFSSVTYNKSFTTFTNKDFFQGSKMKHYDFSLAVGLKFKLNHIL